MIIYVRSNIISLSVCVTYAAYILIMTLCFMKQSIATNDNRSLVDIVRSGAATAMNDARNDAKKQDVPGYNEADQERISRDLNNIDPNILEARGASHRDAEIKKNPDNVLATSVEVARPEHQTNYKHYHNKGDKEMKMFTLADSHMRDPVANMSRLSDEACSAVDSDNARRGYKKSEKIEKFSEKLDELQTCEVPINQFTCQKSLKVSCSRTSDCDYGGIEKGTVASDMSLQLNPRSLTIGTISDNYWNGYCQIYDRSTTFKATNIKQIEEFRITQVGFDDYLLIKVNGHVVYVGPDGGSSLEVVIRDVIIEPRCYSKYGCPPTPPQTVKANKVYNGVNDNICERNTNWVRDVNIDIKPYLQEGHNVIDIRVIVTGAGEGWLKIRAKARCCAPEHWQETWEEHCEQG